MVKYANYVRVVIMNWMVFLQEYTSTCMINGSANYVSDTEEWSTHNIFFVWDCCYKSLMKLFIKSIFIQLHLK